MSRRRRRPQRRWRALPQLTIAGATLVALSLAVLRHRGGQAYAGGSRTAYARRLAFADSPKTTGVVHLPFYGAQRQPAGASSAVASMRSADYSTVTPIAGTDVNQTSEASQPSTKLETLPAEVSTIGTRVGLLMVPSFGHGFREQVRRLNVTDEAYFETEVPDALQVPLIAKFLAMSQTVDVIIAAHGDLKDGVRQELLRAYQSVALTTSVAIVPWEPADEPSKVADIAVRMGDIRQQAVLGGDLRTSLFFGIGKGNETKFTPRKQKVYF
eukprot:TRINITY_DN26005_c0_g1_i2.p1 TRINITY_DN26005_c0_g1~~TRINITY_DN26005_c0_g1_i2.p1  ORF type:complete len:270 (-),score=37.11 TRINITY_DN26005_c0_g1_i2:295-1104(-)